MARRVESAAALSRVAVTNDVALDSKVACAHAGYTYDPAALRMYTALGKTLRRRTALVSLGYCVRVRSVTDVVTWFCEHESVGAVAHKKQPQLIALGAGHDTMHWRVRGRTHAAAGLRTIDIDLPPVARSKAAAILSDPELLKACGAVQRGVHPCTDTDADAIDADDSSCEDSGRAAVLLVADSYAVVGVDVTDVGAVSRALSEIPWFDFDAPTIVMSECVLAYLHPDAADGVVAWAAASLRGAACFVEHAPVDLDDGYGKRMEDHFAGFGTAVRRERGSVQSRRFIELGWRSASTTYLSDVLDGMDADERARILRLEVFDEHEELWLALQHYTIVVATSFGGVVGPYDDLVRDIKSTVERSGVKGSGCGIERGDVVGEARRGDAEVAAASAAAAAACTVTAASGLRAVWKPSVQLDTLELRRWNASVVTVNASIVCFGGYGGAKQTRCGDTWVLDTERGDCTVLTSDPAHFSTVSCALVASVDCKSNSIFRFGGRAGPAKPSNALLRTTLGGKSWVQVPHSLLGARPPSPRWRHSATALSGARLVVYGGRNSDGHVDDVVAVGLCTDDDVVWCELLEGRSIAGSDPGPRHSHCAAACGDRVVVYGGLSPEAVILGGLFVGAVSCRKKNDDDGSSSSSSSIDVNGICDGTDRGAVTPVIPTASVDWVELRTVPPLPPRFGHACAVVRESCMCVVGGVGTAALQWHEQTLIIDVEHLCWYPVAVNGDHLQREILWIRHAACTVVNTQNETELFVLGGGGNCFAFGAVHNSPSVTRFAVVDAALHASAPPAT
jgi:O-methyltransferase involved in polyketide biosynthesis